MGEGIIRVGEMELQIDLSKVTYGEFFNLPKVLEGETKAQQTERLGKFLEKVLGPKLYEVPIIYIPIVIERVFQEIGFLLSSMGKPLEEEEEE